MRFTCASGLWRSVEFAPPGRADDGRSGGGEPRPSRGERFRYDHLLLTGPERVWVTAVIRSRLEPGERSAAAHHMPGLEGRCSGAPEVVLEACDDADSSVRRQVRDMAHDGLRVIAVAEADLTQDQSRAACADPDAFAELCRNGLRVTGLLGLSDTPRSEAAGLLVSLAEQDIGVRLITGDHPITARAIANELGLSVTADQVIRGGEWEALSRRRQEQAVAERLVFARMSPENKVQVVQTLERTGRIYAMVGTAQQRRGHPRRDRRHRCRGSRQRPRAHRGRRDVARRTHQRTAGRAGRGPQIVAARSVGTMRASRRQCRGSPVRDHRKRDHRPLSAEHPAAAAGQRADRRVARGRVGGKRAQRPQPLSRARPPSETLWRTIGVRGATTAAGATLAWILASFTGRPQRASTVGLVALVATQLGQTLLDSRSRLVVVTAVGSLAALAAIVSAPGLSQLLGNTPLGPIRFGTGPRMCDRGNPRGRRDISPAWPAARLRRLG